MLISACYSGGFIDALADEHTLVITAARADRRSFGCTDENEFTDFGRAYFKEALPQSGSFQEAFRRAEALVGEWEKPGPKAAAAAGAAGKDEPSLPQMKSAPAIDAYLRRWWEQTTKDASSTAATTPATMATPR